LKWTATNEHSRQTDTEDKLVFVFPFVG